MCIRHGVLVHNQPVENVQWEEGTKPIPIRNQPIPVHNQHIWNVRWGKEPNSFKCVINLFRMFHGGHNQTHSSNVTNLSRMFNGV
jgi:hypothetical protein